MIKMSRFAKLAALRRDFLRAEKGNVIVTFAIAMVPLIGLIGASVDYSRASMIRTAMQSAVDSTALAISSAAASQTAAQVQTSAQSYFNSLFSRTDIQNVAVTATYSNSGGSTVKVVGSGQMKTSFMGIMGFPTLNIATSSTSTWGSSRLRVALALDNTGSMASAGKIGALKTATKSLLSQLQAVAANPGDVYVSIIPFSKDVNASGIGTYASNWIDWSDWDGDNGSDSSTTTCTTTSTGKSGKTKKKCTTSTTWVPDNHNTWNGCITDRDQNYDISNTAPNPADASLPDTSASTLFPAEQYDYCPVSMMGLSYNWTSLNNKVDAMYPNGNTNQGIGLAWAWQSLTQSPFTIPAEDSNYTYSKIIILLSDGLNTENRWTTNPSQIDARQKTMCDNVKKAGITLYTIHVNTDGDPTSTLLQYCASSPDKFYILTSANQILTTFQQIGTTLSKLRIAK
jgi:Flp pilus assembly protein TadG